MLETERSLHERTRTTVLACVRILTTLVLSVLAGLSCMLYDESDAIDSAISLSHFLRKTD